MNHRRSDGLNLYFCVSIDTLPQQGLPMGFQIQIHAFGHDCCQRQNQIAKKYCIQETLCVDGLGSEELKIPTVKRSTGSYPD
ncbi:MAG: hypothetical protein VX026_04570, partial [Myxococcota bacterium]|nr:hypothetical protein [Myxococcota bacterium]